MSVYNKEQMTVAELEETGTEYRKHKNDWDFYLAAYEGTRSLIDGGFAVLQHERESTDNYNRRKAEAYGFNYSAAIVDLFSFYLSKENALRDMGRLATNDQWDQFVRDCNLYGDDFHIWLMDCQKWSSVMGHVGVLIDKSSQSYKNKAEEVAAGVYPYVSMYFPQNILDWEFARDKNNRPYLSKLKLLDEDGTYRLWTTEWWAVYKIDDGTGAGGQTSITNITTGEQVGGYSSSSARDKQDQYATRLSYGDNPFMARETGRGEIPFVWFYNLRGKTRPIGISDVKDIADIDVSIIANLSETEEVITYGAFPMMRKPYQDMDKSPESRGVIDTTGPSAILEFDPDKPDARPDWLEAAVSDPVSSILDLILRKTGEIYRMANIGGMAATEVQTQPKSGVALKSEFQLLNGKLVNKGSNAEEAEKAIKKYWCMWQGETEAIDSIQVEWPDTYDLENLTQDLDNALAAKTLIRSKTFLATFYKKLARSLLPNTGSAVFEEIDKEIDESVLASDIEVGNIPDETTVFEGDRMGSVVSVPVSGRSGAIQSGGDTVQEATGDEVIE